MSRDIGTAMELKALNFLRKQGLELLQRNFNTRMGEIDLIMTDQDTLVFIEVRYRQNQNYGSALESVNFTKQQKLIKTAQYFLQTQKHYQKLHCRFDVIAFSKDNNRPEWIRSAF